MAVLAAAATRLRACARALPVLASASAPARAQHTQAAIRDAVRRWKDRGAHVVQPSNGNGDGQAVTRADVRNIRQHVNPLSRMHQQPVDLPQAWMADSFAHPRHPTLVDIGCAHGTWARTLACAAQAQGLSLNVLGLEIRGRLVELAQSRTRAAGAENLHYIPCNANVDLERVCASIRGSGGTVTLFTVQFPDPHFKKKHHKRRTLTPDLVDTMARALEPGGAVFVQSDVWEMAEHMVGTVGGSPCFVPAQGFDQDALATNANPHALETEREAQCLRKGLPVYRMQFVRNTTPAPLH